MFTKFKKDSRINLLCIDDEDNKTIKAKLSSSNMFNVRMLKDYNCDIRKYSQNANMISLDLKIGEDVGCVSKFITKEIYIEDPRKVIVYLTNFPEAILFDNSSIVCYIIEKKEEIINNLETIYSRIYINDNIFYLLHKLTNILIIKKGKIETKGINFQLEIIKNELSEFNISLYYLSIQFNLIDPKLSYLYNFIICGIESFCIKEQINNKDIKQLLNIMINTIKNETKYISDIFGVHFSKKYKKRYRKLIKEIEC